MLESSGEPKCHEDPEGGINSAEGYWKSVPGELHQRGLRRHWVRCQQADTTGEGAAGSVTVSRGTEPDKSKVTLRASQAVGWPGKAYTRERGLQTSITAR